MVVSWIPLSYSEAMGLISHYTVSYFSLTRGRKRQTAGITTKRVLGMDTGTTTVDGLTPDAEYSVQVSATNGAGTSDLSSAIIVAEYPVGGTCFASKSCIRVYSYYVISGGGSFAGLAAGVAVGVILIGALALSLVTIAVVLIRHKRK
jgi:hypothetical protein